MGYNTIMKTITADEMEKMLKTRDEISQIYRDIYPGLQNLYSLLHSEVFKVWVYDELIEKIKKHSVAHIPHVKDIADCEKHSWFLVNAIQRELAETAMELPEDDRITRAIGWATGVRKNAFGSTPHTMATALTDRGVVIIESQSDMIELPDPNKFNVLLLVM